MKSMISKSLAVNLEFLKLIEVAKLDDSDLNLIRERVIPSFCYDNALIAAVRLDMQSIIYGVALVDFGGVKLPVEHAWVKSLDGQYFDPTYQIMDEENKFEIETVYYSLIELSIDDYFDLASEIHSEKLSKICAIDFFTLRMHYKFKAQFNRIKH